MRFKFFPVTFVILSLFSGCYGKDCITKQTTNPRHLKRLLKTNNCSGCNLGDANLRGANLKGANLLNATFPNYQKRFFDPPFEPPKLEGAIMPDGTIYQGNSSK